MIEYTIKDISIFKPNGKHIGCFAHQLQETFTEYPNVVTGVKDDIQENGSIQPQSITPELVYILMKSIQELNSKIIDLQNQIDILKN
jgi:chloramphenicol O-acetyltransferase